MEPIILGLAAIAALGYGAYRLVRKGVEVAGAAIEDDHREEEAEAARAMAERRRQQEKRARDRRINFLARALQMALLQLNQAADFRRAASWAQKAQEVPLAFRQRQFRRFRAHLVRHFAVRLQAGTDVEILSESLTDLLRSLGISPFEADYIRTAAEGLSRPRRAPAPQFDRQMRDIHAEHERRVAAIQAITTIPDEIREQLTEAEDMRYREALLNVSQ